MILLLCACATNTGETAETGLPPDTADACADAPHLSWETFGQGFLTETCDTCHAATAPDRKGAPLDITFDTVEEAWAWKDPIVQSAAGDNPFMPPGGGTTADDRQRLLWWLTCGVPGT